MSHTVHPPHRRLWSGLALDANVSGASAEAEEVGILGLPFDGASSFRRGSAGAPDRIRSLTPHIAPFTEDGEPLEGLRIHDYGNVETQATWDAFAANAETAAATALRHRFALFLGGDHAVTIPVFAAAARRLPGPIGLLHLDAHLDLMDRFEGRDWSHACTARRLIEAPNVDRSKVAFVGIRSWLDEERAFADEHPDMAIHPARAVWERGPTEISNAVCAQLRGAASIYVTIDIDVLDPAFAPGTGTPEAGGLSTRDLLELLRIVFRELPVRALDLVEVSPPLDPSDITSFAAAKVIYEVFGWVRACGGAETLKTDAKRSN